MTASQDALSTTDSKKRFHHKVRSGCNRCKLRRVKCDETKPACFRCDPQRNRCVRAGFECPGYDPPQIRMFGIADTSCFTHDIEKKCFDSFVTVGARELTRFQPIATQFWTAIAPQLSQVHPAIRHCLIGIGMFQESGRLPELQNAVQLSHTNPYTTALGHFNKSIRAFISGNNDMSLVARLCCCLLFVALTIYLEGSGVAEVHTLAARNLILRYQDAVANRKIAREPVIEELFVPVFERLLMDCSTFSDIFTRPITMSGDDDIGELFDVGTLKVPPSFQTISHAYAFMNKILDSAVTLFVSPSQCDSTLAHRTLDSLSNYLHVLEDVLATLRTNTAHPEFKFYNIYKLLLAHHRVATLMVTSFLGNHDELLFDDHFADFQFILSVCKEVLEGNEIHGRDLWELTLGILPPLFFVATRCRVTNTRREALGSIHMSLRIERAWSSCMAYSLAQLIIYEEGQLDPVSSPVIVSPSSRVRLSQVNFSRVRGLVEVEFARGRWPNESSIHHTTMPYVAHPDLGREDGVPISRKVLQASGYFGLIVYTPTIHCHCKQTT